MHLHQCLWLNLKQFEKAIYNFEKAIELDSEFKECYYNLGNIYSDELYEFDKAIKKIGIDRRLYTSGENKAILDPFLPENEDDIKRFEDKYGREQN